MGEHKCEKCGQPALLRDSMTHNGVVILEAFSCDDHEELISRRFRDRIINLIQRSRVDALVIKE